MSGQFGMIDDCAHKVAKIILNENKDKSTPNT